MGVMVAAGVLLPLTGRLIGAGLAAALETSVPRRKAQAIVRQLDLTDRLFLWLLEELWPTENPEKRVTRGAGLVWEQVANALTWAILLATLVSSISCLLVYGLTNSRTAGDRRGSSLGEWLSGWARKAGKLGQFAAN